MMPTPRRNPRSWIALAFGAVSLGTGLAWMLNAAWGVAPLDAFIAGSAEVAGLTIGTVIVLLSLVLVIGGAWGIGTVAILVLLPLALGWLTPRLRRWVHASRDERPTSHVGVGGAIGK